MNDAAPNPIRSRRAVVGALSATLQHMSPGDLAALRRMQSGSPHCPAFWKLLVAELADQLPTDDAHRRETERRWGVIVAAMANGLLSPGRRFGSALGEAVPEARVVKLLRAHDEALANAVRVTVHHLASQGVRFDPFDLARLVLSDGGDDEDDVRRNIYQDYFAVAPGA